MSSIDPSFQRIFQHLIATGTVEDLPFLTREEISKKVDEIPEIPVDLKSRFLDFWQNYRFDEFAILAGRAQLFQDHETDFEDFYQFLKVSGLIPETLPFRAMERFALGLKINWHLFLLGAIRAEEGIGFPRWLKDDKNINLRDALRIHLAAIQNDRQNGVVAFQRNYQGALSQLSQEVYDLFHSQGATRKVTLQDYVKVISDPKFSTFRALENSQTQQEFEREELLRLMGLLGFYPYLTDDVSLFHATQFIRSEGVFQARLSGQGQVVVTRNLRPESELRDRYLAPKNLQTSFMDWKAKQAEPLSPGFTKKYPEVVVMKASGGLPAYTLEYNSETGLMQKSHGELKRVPARTFANSGEKPVSNSLSRDKPVYPSPFYHGADFASAHSRGFAPTSPFQFVFGKVPLIR